VRRLYAEDHKFQSLRTVMIIDLCLFYWTVRWPWSKCHRSAESRGALLRDL